MQARELRPASPQKIAGAGRAAAAARAQSPRARGPENARSPRARGPKNTAKPLLRILGSTHKAGTFAILAAAKAMCGLSGDACARGACGPPSPGDLTGRAPPCPLVCTHWGG